MFGPPQRTQPSSHSSVSSSHQNRPISKSAAPDNLGKPEHLHHRPRRPEEKHPRNHEHLPPYKKFDKVPPGPEFPPPQSNRGGLFNASYPTAQQMAPQIHPPVPPEVPPQPKIAPIIPRVKTPPPQVKIERSIFSPEKCTPPPETLIKPLPPTPPPNPTPNFFQKIAIKEEPVIKLEPIDPIEIKQEISISPKEPPDLPMPAEPAPVEVPVASAQPQPEEHTSHKEKKHKKEKKKHKEHKEKHKDKHKHKHKNKDPEQTRASEGLSLVIKIPKEQITLTPQPETLKIKIPRDKITTQKMPVESPLKIKISHGKIKESKKRDRSEERSPGLPTKYHRANGTTTLQVKDLDVVDCTNKYVEVHSPPSVHFDQRDLSGNSVHSPPLINFDSQVKQFEICSPLPVAHSPPKLDFSQVLSPPSVNLDHPDSSPLAELESDFKVLESPSPVRQESEKRPPSVHERLTVDGVTVEVHSPPSVNFDDMDTGHLESSPLRPSVKADDLKAAKVFEVVKNSPMENDKNRAGKPDEDDKRVHQWNRFSEEHKPNFTGRGGILYRPRGRGVYRPRGVLYRDFPGRPQWAPRPPRPPTEGFRGGYRPGYQQRPVRHQFQHQARPSQPRPRMTSRVNYPYTDPQMPQHQYPDHQNMARYNEQQQQFVEQQHFAEQHYAQFQQQYYQAQQALYASQFSQPPPPTASKNPPPLPDGPPPDIPPPPPPPE